MATVHNVAAYILSKFDKPISTMQLQKLCYYSQGWSLAWDDEPIFENEIQAWANGPVVYDLFDTHRGTYSISKHSWNHGSISDLSKDQRETIDAVVDHYGEMTGQQLSDLTHSERPWLEARQDLSPGARSKTVISTDVMQDFFVGLDQQ